MLIRTLMFSILSVFIFTSANLYAETAKAVLINAEGQPVGTAEFTPSGDEVQMTLHIQGLPSGEHAIHIHGVGLCQLPDFSSAGPHFNPHQKKHGLENPEGPHAGDLPNIEIGIDGTLHKTMVLHGVNLTIDSPLSLFRLGGTAVVIHAHPDDGKSDPAGNAGPRIACGVIEKA